MGAFALAGGGNLLGRGNLPCVGLGLPWFTLAGGGTVVLWVVPDVILGATELLHLPPTYAPKNPQNGPNFSRRPLPEVPNSPKTCFFGLSTPKIGRGVHPPSPGPYSGSVGGGWPNDRVMPHIYICPKSWGGGGNGPNSCPRGGFGLRRTVAPSR